MSKQYSIFLEKAAEALDIPPSKYKQAVARYEAVGAWLESGVSMANNFDPLLANKIDPPIFV